MSMWLNDGEVLVGQGRGEAVPLSPRLRSLPSGSPRLSQRRSPLASPHAREPTPLSPQAETMGKAKELFVLCDKEGKGFITKRDMQRLEGELPLSPEQLETVFESLDRENNGFLTPVEFKTGLGELMGVDETAELSPDGSEAVRDDVDWSQDPTAARFVNILMELGADKMFKDQQELFTLWCELQRDSPELLSALESLLVHAVSNLQDAIRERNTLEQALLRRESEHNKMVRSIYEEMESQIREEKEKWAAQVQDSLKEKQRGQQLEEELKIREQDLENTMNKQKELETRIRTLNCEQTNIREQNRQLRSLNSQLQEQVESSRERLQSALRQLSLLQANAAQEQVARQRNVMRVSRNIKKEKESLMRQLEILRDMNRRLRDEKDAQQTLKMNPNVTKSLQKRGSILGNYLQQDKPVGRRLSSSEELELTDTKEVTDSSKTCLPSCKVLDENVEQIQTQVSRLVGLQRVFKVVFLGNSGVGKTSFIRHYCSKMSSTVGVDFQMKTLILNSTTITLQLWDTAGQERYRSITEQYYRKADSILAMYDVTQSASFSAVRGWMDSVRDKLCEGTVLMLLGNKLDLADNNNREITRPEGERLAEDYQALFHECSAKTGYNMEELMVHLAEMLVTKDDRQCEDAFLLTEDTSQRSCCALSKKKI
ncbi:EF-hand calcium-binding domain-containing protein 4A isoform X1 [Xiphophorus couchianus]|uniref:EF-hand calcium-binding domain-containing protein 4A isoform X1 n=1 Tax=Xiphophorus couchianus TaxID=32473 RepID=UPI001015D6D4|nr:EF-hand calcium-binding domain-containing protein 4A isoform X1 [Xiphophorus couchianus]